jgi:hypothetical protein
MQNFKLKTQLSLISSLVFLWTLISVSYGQSLATAVFTLGNGSTVEMDCVQIIYQGTIK